MRGNSNLLIWCLEMQQKYNDVIHPETNTHDELHRQSNTLQNDIIAAHRLIQQLESSIEEMNGERPDDYIYWKGRVMTVIYEGSEEAKSALAESKRSIFRIA